MKLAMRVLSLLALPIVAAAQADKAQPIGAQNLSFEEIARTMTLAPAIKEASGALPGIMRLHATEGVSIQLESFTWKRGPLLQFPPRDPKVPTEPAAAMGGSLGTSVVTGPSSSVSKAEVARASWTWNPRGRTSS